MTQNVSVVGDAIAASEMRTSSEMLPAPHRRSPVVFAPGPTASRGAPCVELAAAGLDRDVSHRAETLLGRTVCVADA